MNVYVSFKFRGYFGFPSSMGICAGPSIMLAKVLHHITASLTAAHSHFGPCLLLDIPYAFSNVLIFPKNPPR